MADIAEDHLDQILDEYMEATEYDWYEYAGYVVAESKKAVGLGTTYPGDVEMWLPKSQLSGIEYDEGGDSDECRIGAALRAVRVPQWLAEEKELT